ncbi:unnamed protein product, partial [Pelagomonas calceolata]
RDGREAPPGLGLAQRRRRPRQGVGPRVPPRDADRRPRERDVALPRSVVVGHRGRPFHPGDPHEAVGAGVDGEIQPIVVVRDHRPVVGPRLELDDVAAPRLRWRGYIFNPEAHRVVERRLDDRGLAAEQLVDINLRLGRPVAQHQRRFQDVPALSPVFAERRALHGQERRRLAFDREALGPEAAADAPAPELRGVALQAQVAAEVVRHLSLPRCCGSFGRRWLSSDDVCCHSTAWHCWQSVQDTARSLHLRAAVVRFTIDV